MVGAGVARSAGRRLRAPRGVATRANAQHVVAFNGQRCSTPSSLFASFARSPSIGLAVRVLMGEDDPDRGWSVYQRVMQAGDTPGLPFFQSMMIFCLRHVPGKAPDVLQAAYARGLPITEKLFAIFLTACHKTDPPLMRQALDLYSRCGPVTHDVLYKLANLCRVSKYPGSALFLVPVAVRHGVEFSEKLLSLFAACCAESACLEAADTAERLLNLVHSRTITPHANYQLYSNLIKPLLAQGRVDAAVNAHTLMESIGLPPTVHTYTHVLDALAKAGRVADAMSLFQTMVRRKIPVAVPVLACMIAACGRCFALESVQVLHRHARDNDLLLPNDIVVCALILAYSRCGSIADAGHVFQSRIASSSGVPHEQVFSFMIRSYSEHRMIDEQAKAFAQMQSLGVTPSQQTLTTMATDLARCARIADALALFPTITDLNVPLFTTLIRSVPGHHLQTLLGFAQGRDLLATDDNVVSAFIIAFANCGQLPRAEHVFRTRCVHAIPNVATFNAMIAAYAQFGCLPQAMKAFAHMKAVDLRPDAITMTGLIASCSHAGDVSVASAILGEFSAGMKLRILSEHIACLVDLHGRIGDLDAAERIAAAAPNADSRSWISILRACAHCGDLQRAERIFARITSIPGACPHLPHAYDLMKAMLFDVGRDSDARQLLDEMQSKGVAIAVGRTSLHLADGLKDFQASPSPGVDLTALLDDATTEGRDDGDVIHSEVLAVAHALSELPPSEPIRLLNDGRVCRDCHQILKRASSVCDRDVFLRETAGLHHHFRSGACSCGDYW
ncbi:DYW domain-containing protein [Plasmodiophora brassicae]|uniref:DYW domain-containing protein n=1 Tax=Plasmodiophora brassicae TaxID=37360 RepID=A0A0G4IZT3_PLABS|nr:hypothetical protein PBRA_001635 [Plasmodiophora brassicae]